MISIGNFKDISANYDEVWLIVRSLKSFPQSNVRMIHVPELSPSLELFLGYCERKNIGAWNGDMFQRWYVPQFLKEMHGEVQRKYLNKLYVESKNKHILLVCYCEQEELCHRSIICGLMQGIGVSTNATDYSSYYTMYKEICVSTNNTKTMCFTGPRPKGLYGYNHDVYIPIVEATKNALREHITNGYTRFITGGAQGFDQLAFWAVNALKREGLPIKNIVYVPFKGQERAWKETGLFSQQEYRLMLQLADEVHVLYQNINDKHAIIEALFGRNHRMVDDSNAIFGLYPDYSWQLSEAKGGTAECLKYAQDKAKPIFQLSNDTLRGQWL